MRGKAREETLEVRNHRLDLRLLQHHLAEPHAIGRAIITPRQIARIGAKPNQQRILDFGFLISDFRSCLMCLCSPLSSLPSRYSGVLYYKTNEYGRPHGNRIEVRRTG